MFTVYKIINVQSGKYYIGFHNCKEQCKHKKNNVCKYYGSGKAIKQAIIKHGKEMFTKEILYESLNKKDALQKEKN